MTVATEPRVILYAERHVCGPASAGEVMAADKGRADEKSLICDWTSFDLDGYGLAEEGTEYDYQRVLERRWCH